MVDKSSGATPAIAQLRRFGVPHTLHQYDHDPSERHYGDETVAALGIEPGRVFKTLITRCDGTLVVAVLPVPRQLDMKALAAVVGAKRAELADAAVAQRSSGYVVGGISPFGQRTSLPTIVDVTARQWNTILVSAGRRGHQVEVSPDDLIGLLDAVVAPVGH